ncbi:MAG TPA: hypothetical protein VJZ06_03305 [Mobilitalea sp.]|nr:hypothetical protein [Mobilitalea sp.]
MDTERTTTTTKIDGMVSSVEMDETYYHHFATLYQCKCCANIYIDHEVKKTHSHN